MLNVSSNDDRTTSARIRDAAISYVGKHGWDRATSRQIAAEAGVPVGLVNYHYGSKDGLRHACDDWVSARLAEDKGLILGAGPLPRLDTYLDDHPELRPITDYIGQCMRSGGPVAERFFERMVEMTQQMMELAADAGTFRRYDDPYAAAVILVAFGSGASLFGDTIARLLGGTNLLDADTYNRYARSSVEIFTRPLFADESYLHALDSHDVPPASAEGELHKDKE
jgi:TetR/AcrR family transcriptional regulator, regulator of cefoperazone and chloramphenicol sensitivity